MNYPVSKKNCYKIINFESDLLSCKQFYYVFKVIKNACNSLPWTELESCTKIAERSLVVCQSLGLKNEVQFWTVAFHYIMMDDDFATNVVPPLDSCYDVVCDCTTYRVS